MGSFAGEVASKSVTEAYKGRLIPDGNRDVSANAKAGLTERLTSRTGAKAGVSDPRIRRGCGPSLTDKSYPGDNRLIGPESPYRRPGLAPRCRLILSWRWRSFQGSGCSPVKRVRELGSERRKTVDQ